MADFTLRNFDHLVMTTAHPEALIAFYEALGFKSGRLEDRWVLEYGLLKINVHIYGQEVSPHAGIPTPGCQDFCIAIQYHGSMQQLKDELVAEGMNVILGPVPRNGSLGPMTSVYLRDPDGNLVELACY
jgi:catechol 2,3-dioxygenase-like lactoylglutathione lyase family enzyme